MQKIYRYEDIEEFTTNLSSIDDTNSIGVVCFRVPRLYQNKLVFHEWHINLLQKARIKYDILVVVFICRIESKIYDRNIEESIIDTSLFQEEYDKLVNTTNIDYIVFWDASQTIIDRLVNDIQTLETSYLDIEQEENYVRRIELTLRWHYFFGDLFKDGKNIKIINEFRDLYHIIINYKKQISDSIRNMLGNYENATSFEYEIVPLYRNSDSLLWENHNISEHIYNKQKIISDYLKNLNISVNDDVTSIKENCIKECDITQDFYIFFFNFDTASFSSTITENGVLRTRLFDAELSESGHYSPWLDENIFFGIDETKWYKVNDNGIIEL